MNKVREIRLSMMLTQYQFANLLGVSRQMVWAYEKGISAMRFTVAKKLLEIAKNNNIEAQPNDFLT